LRLAALDERAEALRREMAELDRLRSAIPRPPPSSEENDAKTARAVDVSVEANPEFLGLSAARLPLRSSRGIMVQF